MPANAPCVYALSKANVVRSNSRIAGCSAAPDTAGTSGSASASAAIACCSCSGLRNDQRNETASASTLLAVDELTARRRRPRLGSSGRTTLPSRSMRSSTPTTQRGETISGGGVSHPSSSCTRRPRANDTSSSKPFVVISPTRRPTREASTFVTAVVPSPNRRTAGSTDVRSLPARVAGELDRGEHTSTDVAGSRRRLRPPDAGHRR